MWAKVIVFGASSDKSNTDHTLPVPVSVKFWSTVTWWELIIPVIVTSSTGSWLAEPTTKALCKSLTVKLAELAVNIFTPLVVIPSSPLW